MSYCNINDAFNINSNFENTIRDMNSFNPINNTIENIRSGYNCNLNSAESSFEKIFSNKSNSPDDYYEPSYDSFFPENSKSNLSEHAYLNDNLTWNSLNGTDLNSNLNKSNKLPHKLTHRECINIYNNPDSYKDNILSQALKHVSKCKTCKDEIKNLLMISEQSKKNSPKSLSNNSNSYPVSKSNNNLSLQKKYTSDNLSIEPMLPNSSQINSSQTNSSFANSKIESELKLLNDRINGESNLNYQNAMIQNNISKYLEDLEEKKKINYKLDKILELVNMNVTQCNKMNNNILYGEYQNQSLFNSLPPQLLTNLSKLFQNPNSISNSNPNSNLNSTLNSGSTSTEMFWMYIGISFIVLLLIVDIILRFVSKNQ